MLKNKKKLINSSSILLIMIIAFSYIYYKYQFIYKKNFYTVIPNTIYRSAQPELGDLLEWQKKYHIKSILNLRGLEYCNDNQKAAQTYSHASKIGVNTKFLAISSKNMPIPEELMEIINYIEHSPKPLLIHCKHGVDRTSMISAVAKILDNQPIESALREMTAIRGFFPQRHQGILKEFLNEYKYWLSKTKQVSNKELFMNWLVDNYTYKFYENNYSERKAYSIFSINDWCEQYSNIQSSTIN